MGFFDDVPAHEDRFEIEPQRQPDWAGPPENMIGGTVALDVVLVNTGDAALALGGAWAYPTGVALRVSGARRSTSGSTVMRDSFHQLRFGIGLPDGRRVVADGWDEDEDAPARLIGRGGGGGGLQFRWDYWLWPLPSEGTLQIACAWPDEGIEETVVEIDTGPIRAAAARAVELWADDRPVS